MIPAFEKSYVAFWLVVLAVAYWADGIYNCIPILICIGITISHEFAHLRECNRLGVRVRKMVFVWWGAYVDNEQPRSIGDYIQIVYAGIKDSFIYTIVLLLSLVMIYIAGYSLGGFNFAFVNAPFRVLYYTAIGAAIISISNVLPYYFNFKGEVITTDGNFIRVHQEHLAESWNDGKMFAQHVSGL